MCACLPEGQDPFLTECCLVASLLGAGAYILPTSPPYRSENGKEKNQACLVFFFFIPSLQRSNLSMHEVKISNTQAALFLCAHIQGLKTAC